MPCLLGINVDSRTGATRRGADALTRPFHSLSARPESAYATGAWLRRSRSMSSPRAACGARTSSTASNSGCASLAAPRRVRLLTHGAGARAGRRGRPGCAGRTALRAGAHRGAGGAQSAASRRNGAAPLVGRRRVRRRASGRGKRRGCVLLHFTRHAAAGAVPFAGPLTAACVAGLALLSRKELRNAYDAFTEAIRLSPRKVWLCLGRLAWPAQR
jgi:hypothetical protein